MESTQYTPETAIRERIASNRASIAAMQREQQELEQLEQNASKQKGVQKWNGFSFKSSSGLTPEFAAFAKDFKKHIATHLPNNAMLVNFSREHFYCSGFIKRGEKYCYFSISDVRHFGDWQTNILVRTAKGEKDYTGGSNCYATLENFTERVEALLAQ